MENIRDYLSTVGFKFKREWARVISGEEEGVYGWLTVNKLHGRLPAQVNSPVKGPPIGALDLGGASTQITFQSIEDVIANLYNVKLETIVDTGVYTHSFLYFGEDQALVRVNEVSAGHLHHVEH